MAKHRTFHQPIPHQSPSKKPSFSAFTTHFSSLRNRLINNAGITEAFDIQDYQNNDFPFTPIFKQALWDTGSTKTMINQKVIGELKLSPIGTVKILHAGGSSEKPTFLINLYLPNKLLIPGVMVSEFDAVAGDFDIIIGMDIILLGDFSLTNLNSQTTLSFRYPSIATIDYVQDAKLIKYAGTNLYDFCPCGAKDSSGKRLRYIDCCGKSLRKN